MRSALAPSESGLPSFRSGIFAIVAAAVIGCGTARGPDSEPVSVAPGDGSDRPVITQAPSESPQGMSWIPGGTFRMGTDTVTDMTQDEKPAHSVTLDGFWIDQTEVTNAQYLMFVEATGYVTTAEKTPTKDDFADQVDVSEIPPENLVAGSICFNSNFDMKQLRKDSPLWPYQVWKYTPDANWRHPGGKGTSINDRLDHPVVHVSWHDAQAYCEWIGKELPTEAEWEYAARGGLSGKVYPWGNERNPGGKWLHNIWQGEFPIKNEGIDGFQTTAPVKSFPPNGYGLWDMSGNVWEWCNDWYRPDYYRVSSARNPHGPDRSFDPLEPTIPKRVQRGGSFMCSDNYCVGYRTTSRMKGDPGSSLFHTGFRTVLRPERVDHFRSLPARKVEAEKSTKSTPASPEEVTPR